ncbi:hypothetical protein AMTRI_Chr07g27280 [Amborella trichopoda]
MALSISHQIGALSGTPIRDSAASEPSVSSDSMAVVSATATWKSPSTPLRCRIQNQGIEAEGPSPPLSPCCSSPPPEEWWKRQVGRPDLSVACQAFETAIAEQEVGKQEREHGSLKSKENGKGGIPVFVMLPLDSVTQNHGMNRKRAMNASLQALKSAGVEGIMLDVWWGLVERDEPGNYNWGGYTELFEMARKHGLKVQAVMSFHQCGGNVGDSCTIPLPKWVLEETEKDPDLAYTDQWRRRNYECVSLGCDELPVLKGRSPAQCYSDFMRAFGDNFKDLLGETIVEIQVGMGPAGELRYPSYPELNGTWKFPGIGAFQCYDKYMLSSLKAAAEEAGKSEWGHGGPSDAGHYNNWPEDAPFFKRDGGWSSPYGEFFLSWYSQMLLDHGELILTAAETIFDGSGAKLSGKVAGIHWHYGTRSHAPELTAGYYNTRFRDGYLPIARLFARHGVVFNFTCIEMKDYEQPQDAQCSPERLVHQVVLATREAKVPLAGENALPRYDEGALNQILNASSLEGSEEAMCAFTYLRMSPDLFRHENWRLVVAFVRKMGQGKEAARSWEQLHGDTESFVHATQPLVQEAATALMHG